LAAASLFGGVVAVGVAAKAADTDRQPTTIPGPASVATGSTAPPPSSVPTTTSTATAAEPVPLTRTLGDGVTGPDVRRVQQRLTELGFDPGGVDGVFGPLTIQATWAYEKLVVGTPREQVTGQVTPEMWNGMQQSTVVTPRRPQPPGVNHTEIYLPEQALAVFHDGRAVFVAHMSHGTGEEWCEEVTISPGEYGNEDGTEPVKVGRCGISNTPGGIFTYHREVEGRRESALGGMLNPVYFNYGIAVHGASNVPNYAASHGCVRIPNDLSARYQSLVAIGERVFVWDGVEEPEVYGEQLPTFDWEWEEYAATTTTPPTTSPTTTPPPTTSSVTTAPPSATRPSSPSTSAPTTAASTTTALSLPATSAPVTSATGADRPGLGVGSQG
jgi:peptidoglycan hydrolase-like protein with peptidoglycan-binding domain